MCKNNRTILFLVTLLFINYSFITFAHECILKGETAQEINQYNLCLNDQISQSKTQNSQIETLNREIYRLQDENNFLKGKINKIELMLYQILKEI